MRKRTRYGVASAVEPRQKTERSTSGRPSYCVAEDCVYSARAVESDNEEDGVAHAGMIVPIANQANLTTINLMSSFGNATDLDFNTTDFDVKKHWNTTGLQWAQKAYNDGIYKEKVLENDVDDFAEVLHPEKKGGITPMILAQPLVGMLVFLSLFALIVMFKRHPVIAMVITASIFLATGAYILVLDLWTSEESAYHTTFDPRAPPKYE